MRRIAVLSLITISSFLLFSCSQDNYIVSSDRAPEEDLNKIDTYAWAKYADNNTTATYTLNDMLLKTYLRGEIREELQGHGFEKSKYNPDVLVNFIVFEKPTKFTGYGVVQEDDFFYDYYFGFGEDMDLGKPRTYSFDEGTLLIQMVEKETGKMLWQGYASGIMDGDVFDRDDDNIEEAVELIFSTLDARGDNYQVGQ